MRRTRRLGGDEEGLVALLLYSAKRELQEYGANCSQRYTAKTGEAMDTSYSTGNAQKTVGKKKNHIECS